MTAEEARRISAAKRKGWGPTRSEADARPEPLSDAARAELARTAARREFPTSAEGAQLVELEYLRLLTAEQAARLAALRREKKQG